MSHRPWPRPRRSLAVEFLENRQLLAARIVDGLAFEQVHDQPGTTTETNWASQADVDGDGHIDLLLESINAVSFLPGNGMGGFGSSRELYSLSVTSTLVDDIDRDNDPDLLLVSESGNVTILENRGRVNNVWAGFAPPESLRISGVSAVHVATDLNRDGQIDLVTSLSDSIRVFHGRGGKSFGTPVDYPMELAEFGSRKVAVGDADGDGDPDLLVMNRYSIGSTLFIFANDGDGIFEPIKRDLSPDRAAADFDAGDLDRDGDLDLIVAFAWSIDRNIVVFKGQGNGRFEQDPQRYSVFGLTQSVSLSDTNGDGNLDAIVAHHREIHAASLSGASIMLGSASGRFRDPVLARQTDTVSALSAQLDADAGAEMITFGYSGAITVVRLVDVPFMPPRISEDDVSTPYINIRQGEWNGDDQPDFVANTTTGLELRINQGNGTFVSTPLGLLGEWNQVSLTDLNGDDRVDLLVSNIEGTNVSFLQRSDGLPSAAITHKFTGYAALDFDGTTYDLNSDGIPDLLVVATNGNESVVMFGMADGTYHEMMRTQGYTTVFPDITGDNQRELVTTSNVGHNTIWKYTPASGFTEVFVNRAGGGVTYVDDVTGDGVRELITFGAAGENTIWRYAEPAGFTQLMLNRAGGFSTLPDVTGDGIAELISNAGETTTIWRYDVNGFSRLLQTVGTFAELDDVTGDGLSELTFFSHLGGSSKLWRFDGNRFVEWFTNGSNGFSTLPDVTGDGLPELVSMANEGINTVWRYANSGEFVELATARGYFYIMEDVTADGIDDLLHSSAEGVTMWRLATDGTLREAMTFPTIGSVIPVGDVDEDGLPEILTTSFDAGNSATIWHNRGEGMFAELATMATSSVPLAAQVRDLNRDGYRDFVAATWLASSGIGIGLEAHGPLLIELFIGRADGTFGPGITLSLPKDLIIHSTSLEDTDGDGDLDVIVIGSGVESDGFRIDRRMLVKNLANTLGYVGDFDRSGRVDHVDLDTLCAAIRDATQRQPFHDVNGDGGTDSVDLDFLVNNVLRTTHGDANLDGVFDSRDLILVFQAAEYDDAIAANSGWADGDWNCDGEFNSSDLVVAFQKGGYVA